MRARMLDAHGRVMQNGIGEAHMFLITRVLWVEPNGSIQDGGQTKLVTIKAKVLMESQGSFSNLGLGSIQG